MSIVRYASIVYNKSTPESIRLLYVQRIHTTGERVYNG